MATCPTCEKSFSEENATCPDDGSVLLPDDIFVAQNQELTKGTRVGEYEIQSKLGEGGFGAVYEAMHPVIGKAAAVKVLSRQFSSDPQMVSRFIAEARAVNQIRHKNIIDVFAFGMLPDGRQYYVMELLRGSTFSDLIKKRGRLTPSEVMPILRGIARALDAAHKNAIVHRDLKPENVFLQTDDDGTVTPKLLDFGIAKLSGDAVGASHKTKTGTAMGTPYYMSPEQARGVSVDYRTDVYSFGVLTYEALTGGVPFTGESSMDILIKHMTAAVPLLSDVDAALANADVPIIRMMAKEPGQRYDSVGHAVEALAAALDLAPASHVNQSLKDAIDAPRPPPSEEELAKTAVDGTPLHLETSMSTEADVTEVSPAPARRSSALVFVVGAVALVAGVGLAAALVNRGMTTRGSNGGASASSEATNPSNVIALSANGSGSGNGTLESRPTPTDSIPIAPATAASSIGADSAANVQDTTIPDTTKISVRIDTVPARAQVYQGDALLGIAPGPFSLEKGKPATLTVRASGYATATVSIAAETDETKRIALQRNTATTGTGPKLNKDLESPFQ